MFKYYKYIESQDHYIIKCDGGDLVFYSDNHHSLWNSIIREFPKAPMPMMLVRLINSNRALRKANDLSSKMGSPYNFSVWSGYGMTKMVTRAHRDCANRIIAQNRPELDFCHIYK